MAINWKNAQTNEKKFWKDVYINNVKDDVYSKTSDQGWKSFALQVFNRHDLDKNYLNDKIVLDLKKECYDIYGIVIDTSRISTTRQTEVSIMIPNNLEIKTYQELLNDS